MSERTISIVSDSFALWGQTSGAPTPPERDFAKERAADRITHTELIKERRWSEAQVAQAEKFGLLKADYGIESHPGSLLRSASSQRVYSRSQIAERIAELKAFAGSLK
jgi:hypothetical protein